MFIASIDTRHFNFTALDVTETQAKKTLMKGWAIHCEQYPEADPEHVTMDDISITQLFVGQCTRDGEVLKEGAAHGSS